MANHKNYIPEKNILKNTRRGPVRYKMPFIEVINIKGNEKIRSIVKEEIDTFLNDGKQECFDKLIQTKQWEKDDVLLLEYIKLFKEIKASLFFVENPESRNNVVVNEKCCISWIQRLKNCLYVVQRSQDIKAYNWDKETLIYLAQLMSKDIKKIYWVQLHKHEYLANVDGSKEIQRRKG